MSILFEAIFDVMRYPAGELHVRLKKPTSDIISSTIIAANVRSFDDLCAIVIADRILKHGGIPTHRWFIPYFPFARHDRRNDALDGFELKLALELVQDLQICILDPHSDVAGQLTHVPQSAVVDAWRKHTDLFEGQPLVVIPDYGATKKALTWMPAGLPWVQAYKKREPKTGKLSGFGLHWNNGGIPGPPEGHPVVIVDDICDAGGTFIGLAQVLKEDGATDIRLAVTHGLFTKGIDELSKHFSKIYSTGPQKEVDTVSYDVILEERKAI